MKVFKFSESAILPKYSRSPQICDLLYVYTLEFKLQLCLGYMRESRWFGIMGAIAMCAEVGVKYPKWIKRFPEF